MKKYYKELLIILTILIVVITLFFWRVIFISGNIMFSNDAPLGAYHHLYYEEFQMDKLNWKEEAICFCVAMPYLLFPVMLALALIKHTPPYKPYQPEEDEKIHSNDNDIQAK